MTASAPRIAPELMRVLTRIDDGRLSYAEITRRIGAYAEAHGYTRPSYERVRALVHLGRSLRSPRGPSTLQLLWEAGAGWRSGPSVMTALGTPREERRSTWR